ncbi:MAG: 30S ribosomal protein S4 [Candidatus Shapirobacteria bacterium]|nr:30S ribosomal protein S4 [Candidatus Shapirobacteria bacterium]MDD5481576.1 30S ribosomal protein S4 [Candidatus Shapirobacteria bacterium]
MRKLQNNKCRICRRFGIKLFLKGKRCYEKCPIDRAGAIPPGVHGRKFSRPTFYSEQLKEKQRLKAIYGLNEAQMKTCFKRARNVENEPTDEVLLQILESRLDNVLYRLGFSPNRRSARQMVVHGKVLVDGQKVTIPSYQVKIGQVVSLTGGVENVPQIKQALEEETAIPDWLERKALAGTVKEKPKKDDIEVAADVSVVIEFYSR